MKILISLLLVLFSTLEAKELSLYEDLLLDALKRNESVTYGTAAINKQNRQVIDSSVDHDHSYKFKITKGILEITYTYTVWYSSRFGRSYTRALQKKISIPLKDIKVEAGYDLDFIYPKSSLQEASMLFEKMPSGGYRLGAVKIQSKNNAFKVSTKEFYVKDIESPDWDSIKAKESTTKFFEIKTYKGARESLTKSFNRAIK